MPSSSVSILCTAALKASVLAVAAKIWLALAVGNRIRAQYLDLVVLVWVVAMVAGVVLAMGVRVSCRPAGVVVFACTGGARVLTGAGLHCPWMRFSAPNSWSDVLAQNPVTPATVSALYSCVVHAAIASTAAAVIALPM